MSTPSPLQPQSQGTLDEATSPKSRVRITVLTILALHVVVIGGLLLQGCDKRPTTPATPTNGLGSLPSLADPTNAYYTSFPGDAAQGGTPGGGPGGAPAGTAVIPPVTTLVADPLAAGPGVVTSNPPGGVGAPAGSSVPPIPGAFGMGGGNAGVGAASNPGLAPLSNATAPTLAVGGGVGGGNQAEHVIQKGDTLGALARKYRVTEKAIIEANPTVKPRNLRIDDKILIPAPVTPPAAAAGSASTDSATGAAATAGTGSAAETYVVKPGDTLARIAKKFGVSVKALRGANNIKGDRIIPKQKLTIPTKAVPTTTVDPGAGRSGAQP